MDIERFEDLVDRHGEDISQWPSAVRDEAETFVAATPAARECLRRARALRAAFASTPPIRAPRDLTARIMASIETDETPSAFVAPGGRGAQIRLPQAPSPDPAGADTVFGSPARDVFRRPLRSLMAATFVFALGLTLGVARIADPSSQVAAEETLLFLPIIR